MTKFRQDHPHRRPPEEVYGQAVPVIETAVGVAWNRGPWEIRGRYELANWFNLVDLSAFVDFAREGACTPQSNDFLLDGVFIRFGYTDYGNQTRPCFPRSAPYNAKIGGSVSLKAATGQTLI